jgi:flagellum-specific ATP synthase
MRDITFPRHLELAGKARGVLADYSEAEDLINIGAYAKGSNPKIDYAISKIEALNDFLQQNYTETTTLKESIERLGSVLSDRKDDEPLQKNRRQTDRIK